MWLIIFLFQSRASVISLLHVKTKNSYFGSFVAFESFYGLGLFECMTFSIARIGINLFFIDS